MAKSITQVPAGDERYNLNGSTRGAIEEGLIRSITERYDELREEIRNTAYSQSFTIKQF